MPQCSKIEWCDATWNAIRGCSRVSQGCVNCYAERTAARFSGKGQPYEGLAVMKPDGPHWAGEVRLVEELLDWPLRWRGSKQARAEGRPSRIFVNSMSDLFHEGLGYLTVIGRVWKVMEQAPQHVFQVLTKRPGRMLDFMQLEYATTPPPAHIWLGVSVEDQAAADERIPLLLQTPAAVRWISAEPLLGPIDLRRLTVAGPSLYASHDVELDALSVQDGPSPDKMRPSLNWVVVGGESGRGARPMHPGWARSLRDQCQVAGVPFFFKQWGQWKPIVYVSKGQPYLEISVPMPRRAKPSTREIVFDGVNMLQVGKKAAGRLLYGREWNEFPEARA